LEVRIQESERGIHHRERRGRREREEVSGGRCEVPGWVRERKFLDILSKRGIGHGRTRRTLIRKPEDGNPRIEDRIAEWGISNCDC